MKHAMLVAALLPTLVPLVTEEPALSSPRPVPPPRPVDRSNPVLSCECGHDHPIRNTDWHSRDHVAQCCPTCSCRRFRTPRGVL